MPSRSITRREGQFRSVVQETISSSPNSVNPNRSEARPASVA